jgi:VanZ family protein
MPGIWAPPVAMAALIFLLSSVPGHSYPHRLQPVSQAAHAAEFALLAFLLARALGRTLPASRLLVPVAISLAFCVIYGIADEVHQLFVPERVFDVVDMLFDAVGAVLGVSVYGLSRRGLFGRGGRG